MKLSSTPVLSRLTRAVLKKPQIVAPSEKFLGRSHVKHHLDAEVQEIRDVRERKEKHILSL